MRKRRGSEAGSPQVKVEWDGVDVWALQLGRNLRWGGGKNRQESMKKCSSKFGALNLGQSEEELGSHFTVLRVSQRLSKEKQHIHSFDFAKSCRGSQPKGEK